MDCFFPHSIDNWERQNVKELDSQCINSINCQKLILRKFPVFLSGFNSLLRHRSPEPDLKKSEDFIKSLKKKIPRSEKYCGILPLPFALYINQKISIHNI